MQAQETVERAMPALATEAMPARVTQAMAIRMPARVTMQMEVTLVLATTPTGATAVATPRSTSQGLLVLVTTTMVASAMVLQSWKVPEPSQTAATTRSFVLISTGRWRPISSSNSHGGAFPCLPAAPKLTLSMPLGPLRVSSLSRSAWSFNGAAGPRPTSGKISRNLTAPPQSSSGRFPPTTSPRGETSGCGSLTSGPQSKVKSPGLASRRVFSTCTRRWIWRRPANKRCLRCRVPLMERPRRGGLPERLPPWLVLSWRWPCRTPSATLCLFVPVLVWCPSAVCCSGAICTHIALPFLCHFLHAYTFHVLFSWYSYSNISLSMFFSVPGISCGSTRAVEGCPMLCCSSWLVLSSTSVPALSTPEQKVSAIHSMKPATMSNTNLLEGTIDLEQKDLAMLRKQYEAEKPSPSSSTTFNYAWGLVHSNRREEIQLGVELLTQLVRTAPTMRDEARYYAALGCFKMGEFSRARDMAQAILKDHPNNPQALSIVDAVDEQVRKDGMIGMAIVGGAVAAVGLVVGLLTRSSK